jgi:carboxymethylenebutenolidase
MCDDLTEQDLKQAMALDRRTFAAIGAGAATLALAPGCVAAAPSGLETKARDVVITTPDGKADGYFVAPAKGRHPAVLMWPDIGGLRDAYKTMATRLAAAGYAVLAINQYYRSSPAPVLPSFAAWRTPEGQAKLKPMIEALTTARVEADGGLFVDWLDKQPEVDGRRKVGTCGYCMGGPFTVRTAHARPARVGAAASFHGANLVNDQADSPHKLLAATKAGTLDGAPAWLAFLRVPTLGANNDHIPLWIKFSCALVMCAGTAVGGWKIIRTMGHKMVKLQPIHGFAAETTAAIVLGTAASLGMPVSTTHAITTSIMGVGCAKRFSALKLGVVERILWAWVLTLPVTATLGYVFMRLSL